MSMTKKELNIIKKQVDEIKEFLRKLPDEREDAVQPTRVQFTRLLSAPASARKIPGIPVRMNEDGEYKCNDEEAETTKNFLNQMFHVYSKESLLDFQRVQFRSSVHYEQFMTFWKGAPLFNVNTLDENVQEIFNESMQKASAFAEQQERAASSPTKITKKS